MTQRTSLVIGLLAMAVLPFALPSADAVQAAFEPAQGASSIYLMGTLAMPLPVNAGPVPLLGVVSSVMPPDPAQFEYCSVQDSFDTCSAQVSGEVCSALNANDNVCTVTRGDDNSCSVHVAGGICSVLPPIMTGGDSICSAASGDGPSACSTLTTDGKQMCSVKAMGGSTCSSYLEFEVVSCSVFNLGGTIKSFCSTKLGTVGVSKLCSAFGASMECSIQLGGKGRCSAFGSADPASCTAFAAGAFCSVIGGAAGNPCNQ